MATYVGKIKADGTNELPIAATLYGTCATAAATAAKVVVCANFDKLITGVTIKVKFTYANGVANPTLNVNSTGAIAIMRYGTTRPSTSAATSWNAGAVVSFTYDGTYWQMNDWLVDGNSNTWRNITVNGTAWKGTGTGTGVMNLVSGTGVTLSTNGNDLTITAEGGGDAGNAKVFYGTCDTAAIISAKVVTCADFTSADLVAGAKISVKFTYTNKANSPTMNINSTGAKSIMGYGTTAIGKDLANSWVANTIVGFTYDGTNWLLDEYNPYASYIYQEQNSTTNVDLGVLLTANGASQASDFGITRKNSAFSFNPSTGNLKVPLINNSLPVMVATYGETTYADIKAAYDAGIPVVVYAEVTNIKKVLCNISFVNASKAMFIGLAANTSGAQVYRFMEVSVTNANAWSVSLRAL